MLRFMKTVAVIALSVVLMTLLAACGGDGAIVEAPEGDSVAGAGDAAAGEAPAEAQTLTVSGAFALFPMMTVWGEQYALTNPAVRFDITGGGAGKGITDMLSGVADIAMVSRELKQEEIDQGAFGVPVTIDAVVSTVNADNPYIDEILAHGLTPEAAAAIWMSQETTTWGQFLGTDAAEAITSMRDRIDIVSAERVRDELTKLLLSDRPRAGLEALVESGLADIVFPEIPALQLQIDEHHRHKDVFEHTMIVLERAIALETGPDGPVPAPDLTLRLAAVMHDIGKPKTRRFESGGKVSFHHHDAVGAKMTRKRLKALRFDHHLVEDVSELVNMHLRFHGYVDEPWTDSAVRRYVKDAGHLYERLNRLTRADATTQNKRKAMIFSQAMDEMEERVRELKKKEDFDAIRPDLDGNEIMELLGLEPGPMIGRAYKHMLEYRLDNGPVDHDVAVEELKRWYAEIQ